MHYKFTNVDNGKTAVFIDQTSDGQPFLWEKTLIEGQIIKEIEDLLEVTELPLDDPEAEDTCSLRLFQENVDLMMHNLRQKNSDRGKGSLFKTIQALKPRKITTAG